MPGRVRFVDGNSLVFGVMDHAGTGFSGGGQTHLTSFFRFWTVAASRNSSLAPVRPRNLNRVRPTFDPNFKILDKKVKN